MLHYTWLFSIVFHVFFTTFLLYLGWIKQVIVFMDIATLFVQTFYLSKYTIQAFLPFFPVVAVATLYFFRIDCIFKTQVFFINLI